MTVHFAADENFNHRIVVGLLRRTERIDLVRIQDSGLTAGDDPAVLQWAVDENRVLLTHDVATMPDFAYERRVGWHRDWPGRLCHGSRRPIATDAIKSSTW